jgi:hypothetical protein
MYDSRLKTKAMLALEDILSQARDAPYDDFRSMQLKFILAWLFSNGRGNRGHYDIFWQEAGRVCNDPKHYETRVGQLQRAIESIYFDQNIKRTERLQFFKLHKDQIRAAKVDSF